MAATQDIRPGGMGLPFGGLSKSFVMKKRLDFADLTALAQNETLAICDLPAGLDLISAKLKVVTAQADISDVDLGVHTTGDTDATLIDGATLASTGYKNGAGTRIQLTADTQLVLTNKDAQSIATAVFDVILEVVDMR